MDRTHTGRAEEPEGSSRNPPDDNSGDIRLPVPKSSARRSMEIDDDQFEQSQTEWRNSRQTKEHFWLAKCLLAFVSNETNADRSESAPTPALPPASI